MFNNIDLNLLEKDHGKIKRVFPWLNADEFTTYVIIEFIDKHREKVKFDNMDIGLRDFLLFTHK